MKVKIKKIKKLKIKTVTDDTRRQDFINEGISKVITELRILLSEQDSINILNKPLKDNVWNKFRNILRANITDLELYGDTFRKYTQLKIRRI